MSNAEQYLLANYDFTGFITRLQHTGHAYLQHGWIQSDLLLTYIDAEPTAWLVMHSSYMECLLLYCVL